MNYRDLLTKLYRPAGVLLAAGLMAACGSYQDTYQEEPLFNSQEEETQTANGAGNYYESVFGSQAQRYGNNFGQDTVFVDVEDYSSTGGTYDPNQPPVQNYNGGGKAWGTNPTSTEVNINYWGGGGLGWGPGFGWGWNRWNTGFYNPYWGGGFYGAGWGNPYWGGGYYGATWGGSLGWGNPYWGGGFYGPGWGGGYYGPGWNGYYGGYYNGYNRRGYPLAYGNNYYNGQDRSIANPATSCRATASGTTSTSGRTASSVIGATTISAVSR